MRIYTDASSRGNISGIAYVVTDARDRKVHDEGKIFPKGDNNTAELEAIRLALCFSQDKAGLLKLGIDPDERFIILTDSSYAINAIRFGVCRETEKDLVTEIQDRLSSQKAHLMWIKGHCQDGTILSYYNKCADKLSKKMRKNEERGRRAAHKSQKEAARNGFLIQPGGLYFRNGRDYTL